MKRILVILVAVLFAQTTLFAQSGKSVSEKDVPERFVKDFQRQIKNATNVKWYMVDSLVYDAYFVNEGGTKSACRFSSKGTETRWYVEEKYYPHAIVEMVESMHPGYSIKELYALQIKNKVTYQALVGKKKGFLFFRKTWKNMRYMNFETDGKFIDEIEL